MSTVQGIDPFERLAELATTVNAIVDPAQALPLIARFVAEQSGAASVVVVPRQPWPDDDAARETSWSDGRLTFSPADAQRFVVAIEKTAAPVLTLLRDDWCGIDAALWPSGAVASTLLAGGSTLDIVCFHAEPPPPRPVHDTLRHIAPLAVGFVERTAALHAAESRAARRDSRFHSIVRTTAEGVVVLDAEGRIGYANQRFAEMVGRTVDDLTGMPMAPFVGDGTAFVSMIAEPPLRQVELEVSRIDGTTLPVMVSMRPMRAEGYDTDGTLVMLSDISAHKQAEASLSETRDNLQYLFANNPNPMWVVDETSLHFVSVNDAAITAYGYSREEFLAMTLRDIRPPQDVARVADAMSGRAPRGGVEFWRHRTRNGDIRDVEVMPYRIAFDGKPAWLSLVRDITEKRRAESRLAETEEKLRRAQRLEAIGQLTDGIAHDFNNALAVILGNTEILADEVGTLPSAQEPLAAITEASRHGAELISHLLAFSRSGATTPRLLPVSSTMAAIEPILRRSLPKNIELEVSIAGDAWPIHADRGQLETAMLNLVSNAGDAMPEGGRIIVDIDNHGAGEAAADEQDTAAIGDHVRIRVADTGHGMTPDVLRRAFEPFFTTKRVGRGSGLGLSMVYGFTRQSGGSIDIASSPGIGTTVTLLLPRAHASLAGAAQAA